MNFRNEHFRIEPYRALVTVKIIINDEKIYIFKQSVVMFA